VGVCNHSLIVVTRKESMFLLQISLICILH